MKRNDERRKWLPFFVVLLTLMTVAIVLFFYTCQTTVKVETPAQFPVITETTTTTTTTETTTTTTTTMTTTTTTTTVSVDYTMHIDMTSVKQHKGSWSAGFIFRIRSLITRLCRQRTTIISCIWTGWNRKALQAASMRTIGAILTKQR